MKEDKKILNVSLTSLIEKFSQQNVIQQLEKEYQSSPSRLISTELISDTEFIREVLLSEKIINYFASEISEKGLYNPLLVRPKGNGFELVLGRKRLFGAKKIGIVSMPCVVIDVSDEQLLLMLLADTRDQREGNVVEMAIVYNELTKRFNYSQKTLAELSHQSRSQVTNTMRILRLPKFARDDICLGKLSYGHAKVLVSVDEPLLPAVIKDVYDFNMSVRELENYVRKLRQNNISSSLNGNYSLSKDGNKLIIEFEDPTYLELREPQIRKLLDKK